MARRMIKPRKVSPQQRTSVRGRVLSTRKNYVLESFLNEETVNTRGIRPKK